MILIANRFFLFTYFTNIENSRMTAELMLIPYIRVTIIQIIFDISVSDLIFIIVLVENMMMYKMQTIIPLTVKKFISR